ncbi:MAG TPA: DUF2799 domain-containing protein [Burkholderiaceae bacterium]|nr:DUF2799 domain-containing protein [Burkholderiaceae bacterium]
MSDHSHPSRGRQWAATLVMSAMLGGCAVISEEECPGTDWYQKGVVDGTNGHAASRADNYTRVCSRAGVAVDVTAYYRGREQGLQSYCTAHRGLQEGLRGATYKHVCPAGTEARFLDGYHQGRDVYQQQKALDRLDAEIRTEEQRLQKARNSRERQRIRQNIRNLDHEAARTRQSLRDSEARLPRGY